MSAVTLSALSLMMFLKQTNKKLLHIQERALYADLSKKRLKLFSVSSAVLRLADLRQGTGEKLSVNGISVVGEMLK